jgi:DNA-binding transcriptional LysR family regulator
METNGWAAKVKLRHLRVFETVARHRSLTAAASALGVTQPALSKWLRDLESEVGVALFERGRQLNLCPSGEVLLRHVVRMFGELQRAREEIAVLRRGDAGSIRVGAVFGPASVIVPRAVVMLKDVAPGLAVFLHEDSLDRLIPRLQARELDVVVGRLEEQVFSADIVCEALYHDPASVVARTGHPLMRKKRPTWTDARDYPWIVPLSGAPMRLRLEETFALAGLPLPAQRIESMSPIANLMLVWETNHLAVMSGNLVRHFEDVGSVRRLPLDIKQGLGPVGMLWSENGGMSTAPAVKRFLDCLRAQAGRTEHRQMVRVRRPRAASR